MYGVRVVYVMLLLPCVVVVECELSSVWEVRGVE